ncbi:MAG: transporter substrate-binding domain-containing protein [Burkholderiaceae bacterium]
MLALAVALGLAPRIAAAACSRSIQAPMAPTGRLAFVEGEQLRGVWPDLLRELGEQIGCRFEFPVLPRPRLEMELLQGRHLDLMVPASRTPERDRVALFVPLMRQPLVLLTRQADEGRIGSLAGLRASGWRIAIPRNFAFSAEYRALIRELEEQHRVDHVAEASMIGRMMKAGRIDFALLPPTLAHAAAEAGLSRRRFDGLPLMEVGVYLSRATLAAADLAQLQNALTQAAREGRVRQAFARYYPPDVAEMSVLRAAPGGAVHPAVIQSP